MGKQIKWALLVMLGFATACSSVKNTPKESPELQGPATAEEVPAIRVMYGVTPPVPDVEVEKPAAEATPAAEQE